MLMGKEAPLTQKIIGTAIEVHKLMGPGLLESVYEECLVRELALQDVRFSRQINLPIEYKGVKLENPLKLDLLLVII
jgi:GxxExxY protein